VVWVGVLWVVSGVLATGVEAVVVSGGAGVAVVVLVVDWLGASGAGVVEVSVEGPVLTWGSAASAPPDNGPPRPATVKPPPANAERIARRIHTGVPLGTPAEESARASFTPDIPGPCSLWSRPMVALEQDTQNARAPPDAIHIGREARIGKGFVIEFAIERCDRRIDRHGNHHSGRATGLYRCPRRQTRTWPNWPTSRTLACKSSYA